MTARGRHCWGVCFDVGTFLLAPGRTPGEFDFYRFYSRSQSIFNMVSE